MSLVRRENEEQFGPAARPAVEQMLSAGHSHPWTYVYELTQNAIDAGARRVFWRRIGEETVLFQHDGTMPFDEAHVRRLASLGQSTKGFATIGFMGVGFKSVFARFRRARVSGFEWRFRFDIATDRGDLGARVTRRFDTLRPKWDPESLNPDTDYTTAFLLSRPADPDRPLAADLDKLAAPADPIPLAVLALRGLEEVRMDDLTWSLSARDGLVEVRSSSGQSVRRWRSFASRYRPDDGAMRALLEARRHLQEERDDHGQRPERNVVALLPLDDDGQPAPPSRGLAYATLPTQTPLPFGFHLQADWLVDLDRQNLRPVEGDAWQEAIMRQVPELVRQLLLWLKEEPEQARERGYRALSDPTKDDGPLSSPLRHLRDDFIGAIGEIKIVPIHAGADDSGYCAPFSATRLPGRFRDDFGRQPRWRPDLLFDRELANERVLGKRGTDFLVWLGYVPEVEECDARWSETLPNWWTALAELPEVERTDALFALWHGVDDQGWHDAPVVPTEAGKWLPAGSTRWLNEEPPSEKEASGTVVAKALGDFLPRPDERLQAGLRSRVAQSSDPGTEWLKARRQNVILESVIRRVCDAADNRDKLPLVELLEWALGRGDRRQGLVPLVMTEHGARRPVEAVLADPLVDHGICRRMLFHHMPPLVEDYAIIEDRHAVVLFLERLQVPGRVELKPLTTLYRSHDKQQVQRRIGAEAPQTKQSRGYTVFDYDFPFKVENIPAEALQDWLTSEPSRLRSRGRLRAVGSYYGPQESRGTNPCAWIQELRGHAWLLCKDGERRKPSEVRLSPDPDYEDAPVADIDPELATCLQQEGIDFGTAVPKSPVLRRLTLRGGEDIPDAQLAALLRDAKEDLVAGRSSRTELDTALGGVKLHEAPLLSRVVERCGAGEGLRSDLGEWVVALSSVDEELAAAVRDLSLSFPWTTTGGQALEFLVHIWEKKPARVEQVRSRVAAAYRYVLEDLRVGHLPLSDWEKHRSRACLYGQGKWHPANASSLVVDDVQSPFIRQFLPGDRITVAAAHLGETRKQIRRVAEHLDVSLLSDQVEVRPGSPLNHEPSWQSRLQRLVQTLALLEDRQAVRKLALYDGLTLRVGDSKRPIRAYVQDRVLQLAGEPPGLAVEAADQLVNYFQLRQRGNDVAWLTGALFALERSEAFRTHLKMLAAGLGVEADLDELEPEDRTEPDTDNHEGRGLDAEPEGPVLKAASESHRSAANQVAIFVQPGGNDETAANTADSASAKAGTAPRSDEEARKAVVEFENEQGRPAEEMPANQPGYDVLSRDRSTGKELRRIEVKSVQGRFEGKEASVLLSARQVNDALQQEGDTEYWLYVVDSTETAKPRVFPVPWTRWRKKLRYGFFANGWIQHAEKPSDPPDRNEAS